MLMERKGEKPGSKGIGEGDSVAVTLGRIPGFPPPPKKKEGIRAQTILKKILGENFGKLASCVYGFSGKEGGGEEHSPFLSSSSLKSPPSSSSQTSLLLPSKTLFLLLPRSFSTRDGGRGEEKTFLPLQPSRPTRKRCCWEGVGGETTATCRGFLIYRRRRRRRRWAKI